VQGSATPKETDSRRATADKELLARAKCIDGFHMWFLSLQARLRLLRHVPTKMPRAIAEKSQTRRIKA
jgi:hypothetical protein